MSPSYAPPKRLTAEEELKAAKPRQFPYKHLIPIGYAALIPSVRLALRGRLPQKQIDAIFLGTVFMALGHAGYIMLKSDV
jgi:hypothetical protein